MRRPRWVVSLWQPGALLVLAGILAGVTSIVWLVVMAALPQGSGGLLSAVAPMAAGLAAGILVWLGRKVRRRSRRALGRMLNGPREAALLYVAARVGLADLLADGPMRSEELARSIQAHAASLHRVLRGLVALGICSEEADGRFGITPLGALLQGASPGGAPGRAILCGEEYMAAWSSLLHTVMTGETAFNRAFGMSQWEHRRQHPELAAHFSAGLDAATARVARAVMAAYDFSPFQSIADVGAGHGALLAAVLQAHPSARGILFDLPQVAARASLDLEAAGVADRCQVIGGDFFEGLPGSADLHILKSVIHDWDDEKSVAILKTCREALDERGRLLLIERIMPERVEQDPSVVWVDLQMLAVTGGRERTEQEYRDLLAGAGFSLTRIIPTRSSFSIIEAMPQIPALRSEG